MAVLRERKRHGTVCGVPLPPSGSDVLMHAHAIRSVARWQ
jgi:hypothetical protein